MTDTSPVDMLSLSEAATTLGVQVERIDELIQVGRLTCRRISGQRFVSLADVQEYAAARPHRPKPITPAVERVLDEHRNRIATAQRLVDDLIDERNRAIVRFRDEGHSAAGLARVLGFGRQQIHTILRETRARLAEEAARAQQ